jgi:hypothetical protein
MFYREFALIRIRGLIMRLDVKDLIYTDGGTF